MKAYTKKKLGWEHVLLVLFVVVLYHVAIAYAENLGDDIGKVAEKKTVQYFTPNQW